MPSTYSFLNGINLKKKISVFYNVIYGNIVFIMYNSTIKSLK